MGVCREQPPKPQRGKQQQRSSNANGNASTPGAGGSAASGPAAALLPAPAVSIDPRDGGMTAEWVAECTTLEEFKEFVERMGKSRNRSEKALHAHLGEEVGKRGTWAGAQAGLTLDEVVGTEAHGARGQAIRRAGRQALGSVFGSLAMRGERLLACVGGEEQRRQGAEALQTSVRVSHYHDAWSAPRCCPSCRPPSRPAAVPPSAPPSWRPCPRSAATDWRSCRRRRRRRRQPRRQDKRGLHSL